MTHCGEKWVDMIERTPEVCDMTEDYRRKIDRWIHTCEGIISRGFKRDLVFKKFPEGAHRELPEEDDPLRVKTLNYICECLKRGEKITGSDLKKSIAVWSGKNDTNVSSSRKPLPIITSEQEHDPAPATQTLKQKYGGKDEQVKPPKERVPLLICTTGKCPDGQNHVTKGPQLGDKCNLSGSFLRDMDCCPILERQRRAEEGGFVPASALGPLENARIVKLPGVRIVPVSVSKEQADQWLTAIVRGYLTKNQQQVWESIRKTGELGETDLEIFQGLIDEAGERVGQ